MKYNRFNRSFSLEVPKYIICDCAPQDWGKTETLLNVIENLKQRALEYTISGISEIVDDEKDDYKKDDLYCVFCNKKVKIAILTYGDREDDNTIEDEYLDKIVGEEPDIIVCASSWHTGKVYPRIENIALRRGYKLISFSNLHTIDTDEITENALNKMSAKFIEALIDKYVKEINIEKAKNCICSIKVKKY